MRAFLVILTLTIAGCSQQTAPQPPKSAPPDAIISGFAYLQPETQALQNDEFSNPGYLWVDKGSTLFNAPAKNSKSCASCHTNDEGSLIGAATQYPRFDESIGDLTNLEGRINQCQTQYKSEPKFAYESEELLALTTYVANLSKGMAVSVAPDPRAQSNFDRGQTYFHSRRGQLNLSCAQCHNRNAGKKLRGDTISQGHGNGFPAYRLDWQTLGSLHKRFQYCDMGVRAEPHLGGSQTYLDLEYYLAIRGKGLLIETPAVRR